MSVLFSKLKAPFGGRNRGGGEGVVGLWWGKNGWEDEVEVPDKIHSDFHLKMVFVA